MALRFGPKIVVAVLILVAGVMAGGWIGGRPSAVSSP